MTLTNDYQLAIILKQIRAHGWTRDTTKNKNKKKEYNFVIPGLNIRPTEINAAIGIQQLSKLKSIVKNRRTNYLAYLKIFSNSKYFDIVHENGINSSFVLPFIIKSKYKSYINKLRKVLDEYKVEHRIIAGGSILKHPYKKYFNIKNNYNISNSNYIHDYGFVIGNHPFPFQNKLIRIEKIMNSVFE